MPLHRLKAAGHWFSEFLEPPASSALHAAAEPVAGAADVAAAVGSGLLTPQAVAARVAGAVVAVLGSSVGPDQPLVEAGVDSLGESQLCGGLNLPVQAMPSSCCGTCLVCPAGHCRPVKQVSSEQDICHHLSSGCCSAGLALPACMCTGHAASQQSCHCG